MKRGLVVLSLVFVLFAALIFWKRTRSHSINTPNVGTWKTCVINGCDYEGHLKAGIPHGSGIMYYKNGEVYAGVWKNGRRTGYGRLIHLNGDFDYGFWKDDKLQECKEEYSYFDKAYGIDISYYNKMDWGRLDLYANKKGYVYYSKPKIKEHLRPICFILLKSTEGGTHVDEKYKESIKYARKLRLITGAYHFLTLKTTAKEQADNYICHTEWKCGDLPPILDVEMKEKEMKNYGITKAKQLVLDWLDIIEKHYKVRPVIYTNYSFRKNFLSDSVFNKYDFWIARYSSARPDCNWTFWQFTDIGCIEGTNCNFDINLFDGSFEDLKRYYSLNTR